MKMDRFRRNETRQSPDPLTDLRDQLEQFFEEPFGEPNRDLGFWGAWNPAVDVYEDQDSFRVRAELPGMKKDEINITLHENTLTLSGERKERENAGAKSFRSERIFGRFQRTLTLPRGIEANRVTASYRDGILAVTLPKTEQSKPRQIQIKSDGKEETKS
jgi:HSP20 family protein